MFYRYRYHTHNLGAMRDIKTKKTGNKLLQSVVMTAKISDYD
jgi:hypothetical protein